MKNITAAETPRQSLLVPGAEPRGEIGDGGLGSEASVDQFQQPDAQVSASRCSSGLSKKQKVDWASTPTKTGSALEDLIEEADVDAGEVVLLVDSPG